MKSAKDKVLEVNDTLIENTESLENIALSLSYLYPAILRGSHIDIDLSYEPDKKFYEIMRDIFGKRHFVWKYMRVDKA